MDYSVEVIGGGIGGMAAAVCLARAGARVRLHEQAAAISEVGAGLQIGPNGMKVLRAMGLEAAALAQATQPDRLEMCDGVSGRRIARVPFGETAAARYGAAYVQMHRADLLGVLLAGAEAAGVEVCLGTPVRAADFPRADLVVAADGVRSATRAAVLGQGAPVFTGHVAYRALAPLAPGTPMRTRLFMGQGRHVVLYPLRGGSLLNIVAVEESRVENHEGWQQTADPATLRAAYANWCPEVREALGTVDHVFRWGLYGHPVLPRWHDGARVALLGDACHPMLPYLAQGAVMALEDAWVLTRALEQHPTVAGALQAYESARKPRATRVQARARENGRLYHAPGGPRRFTERTGLAALSALPGAPLLKIFDWLYGHDVVASAASE